MTASRKVRRVRRYKKVRKISSVLDSLYFPIVQCPCCFEQITVTIDCTGGEEQSFVFDCTVCCRPMQIIYNKQAAQSERVMVSSSN